MLFISASQNLREPICQDKKAEFLKQDLSDIPIPHQQNLISHNLQTPSFTLPPAFREKSLYFLFGGFPLSFLGNKHRSFVLAKAGIWQKTTQFPHDVD
ncbi:MAG: hypothetical protein V4541_09010 [Bacteroidota bacterium]